MFNFLIITVTDCEEKGNSNLPWVQYKEKCYYASSDRSSDYLTWQSAEAFCKQNGGFLVSIHSRNELNFISSRVDNNSFTMILVCLNIEFIL